MACLMAPPAAAPHLPPVGSNAYGADQARRGVRVSLHDAPE